MLSRWPVLISKVARKPTPAVAQRHHHAGASAAGRSDIISQNCHCVTEIGHPMGWFDGVQAAKDLGGYICDDVGGKGTPTQKK